MRIGMFGGTFDPIHLGHLILAEQCREQAQLNEVWFVPSARPPHKLQQPVTPFERRAEMVELAIAGQPGFRVEPMEKDRSGPSYTADTLAEIHARLPDAELYLVMGADCLPDLAGWHEPIQIIERATLLAVPRPGFTLWTAEQLAAELKIADPARVRIRLVHVPLIGISSSDLRQRAAEGRSLLYQVPRAVEVYINEKGLYRSG